MINISSKIKLRHPITTDLKDYHNSRNDNLIIKNMNFLKNNTSLETTKKDLQNLINQNKIQPKKYDYFVIEYEDHFAGMIGLSKIQKYDTARIGYWISKKFRGKGIISKAINSILKYAFKKFNLQSIYAKVAKFNDISIHVLKKSHFIQKKVIKNNRKVDGVYYDDLIFIIAKEDFYALNTAF